MDQIYVCSWCGVDTLKEYMAVAADRKTAICRKCIISVGMLLKDCIEGDIPRIIGYEQLNYSANVWGI